MISLHVDLRVLPQNREAFLDAITAQGRASIEREPGCLQFDVVVDRADDCHFMLYEVYTDAGALDAHRVTEHYPVWDAAAKKYVGTMKVTVCEHVQALPEPVAR